MNRLRWAALILATAAVLLLPSLSHAQRWRGGGWGGRGWDGGRWDGGRWDGGRWNGGWWDGGRSSYYYGSGYPYGFSLGYGRGYYSPGYGSSYSYSYPSGYSNSYGPSYYASGQPSYSSYGTPGYSYEAAYPSESGGRMGMDQGGRVIARVLVPDANAKLWIEGQEMNATGLNRTFFSPPIEPGYGYTYTFRAQWTDNGKQKEETRVLQVRPGDRITADFTHPDKSRSSEMRGGARQSGYGPDEEKPRRIDEEVKPPKPQSTPPAPAARPTDRNEKPRPNPDRDKDKPDNPG
jgi:uncharacterized protein (TIGR03000 family)